MCKAPVGLGANRVTKAVLLGAVFIMAFSYKFLVDYREDYFGYCALMCEQVRKFKLNDTI
jgi:hypothetical protein